MSNKSLTSCLFDVINTISTLINHSQQFSLYEYDKINNKWFVEQGIFMIGKAIYKINKLNSNLLLNNPGKIIEAANFITHQYDEVESSWLMHIVQNHLPILKQEIEAILNNLNNPAPTS